MSAQDDADADRRVRTVIIGALAMSLVVWETAFNLGAYRAVFFDRVHWLWVVITTVGICLVFLRQTHVSRRGLIVMSVPSGTFVLQLARAEQPLPDGPIRTLVILLVIATYAAALPYTVFVIANFIDRDLIDLTSRRVTAALLAVAIVIATTGFFVGHNNRIFLVCEDFTVSGNDTPDNCREGVSELIFR